ncbi:MAG: NUDIX domain-containing protein [Bacteroidetes bacterium]|nr:NUDIX domain-containing protein [Bacteroidota bacterium]
MNNIKVFFNEQHLLITTDISADRSNYQRVIADDESGFEFRVEPKELFDEKYHQNILLITPHVEEALESIFNYADGIVAAGGIVENERGEVLIMFRRGYWDLPKGKVEKGEKIFSAARREVEEETGVQIGTQAEPAIVTYHCYVLKGKNCIKETHWYHMTAKEGQDKLTPQTEEDIEQVLWADKDKMRSLKGKYYPLIWALLQQEAGI